MINLNLIIPLDKYVYFINLSINYKDDDEILLNVIIIF
jgi:hypothetical protein